MNACETYREWISASLDGALDETRRKELRTHIGTCAECAACYEAFQLVSGAMELEEPPADLHDRVMDAVRAAMPKQRLLWLRTGASMAACFAIVAFCVMVLRPLFSPKGGAAPAAAEAAVFSTESAVADTAGVEQRKSAAAAPGADLMPPVPLPEAGGAEAPAEEASVETEEAADEADYGYATAAGGAVWDDSAAADVLLVEIDAVSRGVAAATVISDSASNFDAGMTLNVVLSEDMPELAPGENVLVRYDGWEEDGEEVNVYAGTLEPAEDAESE